MARVEGPLPELLVRPERETVLLQESQPLGVRFAGAFVQMSLELGLNPRKLGKLDDRDQEPWKLPLPAFIEDLYRRRFGREGPDLVMSVEERARLEEQRKAARREAKRLRRGEAS